jgi:hypothetical protein
LGLDPKLYSKDEIDVNLLENQKLTFENTIIFDHAEFFKELYGAVLEFKPEFSLSPSKNKKSLDDDRIFQKRSFLSPLSLLSMF